MKPVKRYAPRWHLAVAMRELEAVVSEDDFPVDLDDDLLNEELDDCQDYMEAFEERGWEAAVAYGGGEW